MKLQIVRRIERSDQNPRLTFNLHCWLEVTPQERQQIKDHYDGWKSAYAPSAELPHLVGDVLLLLNDPGPTFPYRSVREAHAAKRALIETCRDLVAYLREVDDYVGSDDIPLDDEQLRDHEG